MWKGRVGVVLLTCVSGAELGLASEVSFFQGQTQASADLASWPWYTPHGSHSPAIRPVCGWSAVPLLRLLGQSHPATGNAARSQAAPLSLSSSVGCNSSNIFESHVAPWADAAGHWHCTTFSSATANFKSGERKRCWWERNHPFLGAREPFFFGRNGQLFSKNEEILCCRLYPGSTSLRGRYWAIALFVYSPLCLCSRRWPQGGLPLLLSCCARSDHSSSPSLCPQFLLKFSCLPSPRLSSASEPKRHYCLNCSAINHYQHVLVTSSTLCHY